jgi:hypothetical protein
MKTLREVVAGHVGAMTARVEAGADDTNGNVAVEAPPLDRNALRRDLERVRKENNVWFGLYVTLLIVLFVASLSVVVVYIERPGVVRAFVSAMGITTAGLLPLMLRAWRSKVATEYLLTLAVNLDAKTMRSVLLVLAKQAAL